MNYLRKKIQLGFLTLAALVIITAARADTFYPQASGVNQPDPYADPAARTGGKLVQSIGPSPKSLNYYLDNNASSAFVFDLMYETLLSVNPETLEYDCGLAQRWSISDDSLTFTFWLDPSAKWSDGQPVTAEDVLWTYDAVMAPENLTGPHKLSLGRLERPEILPDGAIRFRAKQLHWMNLGAAGGFEIMPKHIYEGQDFNKINFIFPVCSGPYSFGELKDGISLTMHRRPDWWQRKRENTRGVYNFDTLVLRFFEDRNNIFDAFKRGDLDVIQIYTASQWHNVENELSAVWNSWIVKQAIHNHAPIGFQGFAMNMRRPPFDDPLVRQAMACLLDRETINRTMMYNQYFLHKSYWEDLYDIQHPCQNPQFSFDKERARALLAQAGWKANPATGLLEKQGKPLQFCFLSADNSTEKFLVIYNETLKDLGITMSIVNKDWSAWLKDMDEFNFDMTWAAWGAGLFKDPEFLWSSVEADNPGSSNLTGFKDPKVDELINQQKSIFSVEERHNIVRQIDYAICCQVPYVLLWNIDCTRLLYWNKFGTPDGVLGKYNDSFQYWWYDEDRDAELTEARKYQLCLPSLPREIRWE